MKQWVVVTLGGFVLVVSLLLLAWAFTTTDSRSLFMDFGALVFWIGIVVIWLPFRRERRAHADDS